MGGFEFDAEKTCGQCGGDGGWEVVDSPDHERGGAVSHWQDCRACDGKGTATVHVQPIDFEDLAAIHGDDDPYSGFAYRGGNP